MKATRKTGPELHASGLVWLRDAERYALDGEGDLTEAARAATIASACFAGARSAAAGLEAASSNQVLTPKVADARREWAAYFTPEAGT
jgi:hypothetical protein